MSDPPAPIAYWQPKNERHPAFRRRAAYHTELTEDLANALIAAVPDYLYLDEVALACHVDPRTLGHWVKRGRRPHAEPLYADFAARFLAADAECQKAWVHYAKLCAIKLDPKAIFSFIDRRWPEPEQPQSFSNQTIADSAGNAGELLASPPPEMIAAMQEAKTVRFLVTKDALELPEVKAALEASGWKPPTG